MVSPKEISASTLMAFPTPMVNHLWDDTERLNRDLLATILELQRGSRGIDRSNVGGWHSDIDFLRLQSPCIVELNRRLREFVTGLNQSVLVPELRRRAGSFGLEGWANVLAHGQYNKLHTHPNAFWSGVYYVNGNETVEGHPMSGKLELVDPRPGAHFPNADMTTLYGRVLLHPHAGQMVLFPSWLQHQVHPNFGETPRVSVAFNVLLAPAERKPR